MKFKRVNRNAIQQKAKVFFRSQQWKEFLAFLVFVALVSCFWLLQSLQQKIEREISIPVYYSQPPKGLFVSDSLPKRITFKLSDKGSVFWKYFFNKKFTAIRVDLKDLPLNQYSYTIERYALNAQIQNLLASTTQILSFQPEKIQVNYSPLQKKTVPVLINGKIATAAGFMFRDSIHIQPSEVCIYAKSADLLDTIRFIETELVNKENISRKLNLNLRLMAPKDVSLDTEKVKLTAEIDEYTEKTIELPALCFNQPENIQVRFFPASVNVISQLPLSQYSQLKNSDLAVSVDYDKLSQNPGTTIKLVLSRKPSWLVHYRIVPESVEYLIEQKRDL